jgi:hypothetical protein
MKLHLPKPAPPETARPKPSAEAVPTTLALEGAGMRLADWGFLATPDLPDRPGPAHLLVAMRERPTLRHFDPERIEYWVSDAGRGRRAELTLETRLPVDQEFSWGPIRLVDRIPVTNEYLTFGGHLAAGRIGESVIAVFTSPAPILRRGGHSQGWDPAATDLGAFFGRLMVAVDYAHGFEALVAAADPVARYAAFVADLVDRYRRSDALRAAHPRLWALLPAEERRLRREHPAMWATGLRLLAAARHPA